MKSHKLTFPMDYSTELKVGDLVWQQRNPGGVCIVLRIIDIPQRFPDLDQDYCWDDDDYPILRVLHPKEGVIEDPSYYYTTIEKALCFED
tara:strand:+ start:4114 stop:4383 length:270 start_codon:yes stop_codon:yes gene_type:complete